VEEGEEGERMGEEWVYCTYSLFILSEGHDGVLCWPSNNDILLHKLPSRKSSENGMQYVRITIFISILDFINVEVLSFLFNLAI